MYDSRLAGVNDTSARQREPKICLSELMQIIMQGIYPSEARLEYMLDHIEGTP
ncbi:hypothetical protein [Profundibacter sp.]